MQAGDLVLAIGNPLGLASSVTEGIVSAVGRTVTEPAESGSPGATLPLAHIVPALIALTMAPGAADRLRVPPSP